MPVQASYWILPVTCTSRCLFFVEFEILFFSSDKRTRQFDKFTIRSIILRRHRHGNNTRRRSITIHFRNLCSDPRIDSWYRGFPKLPHLSYVLIYYFPTYSVLCLRFKKISACDTTVDIQMSFGGKNWTISPADFQLSKLTKTQCLGAFFEIATGSSAPAWIVGDTFLVRSN